MLVIHLVKLFILVSGKFHWQISKSWPVRRRISPMSFLCPFLGRLNSETLVIEFMSDLEKRLVLIFECLLSLSSPTVSNGKMYCILSINHSFFFNLYSILYLLLLSLPTLRMISWIVSIQIHHSFALGKTGAIEYWNKKEIRNTEWRH